MHRVGLLLEFQAKFGHTGGQKLGVTFNSDKLGGIDFTKISN